MIHRLRPVIGALAWVLCLSAAAASAAQVPDSPYGLADFARTPKFDTHVHANASGEAMLEAARADNFELLSINVDYPDFPPIDQQFAIAQRLRQADPKRFHFAATFSMEGWGGPNWARAVNERLVRQVAAGAVAVKIWKNVGMSYRDASGALVMIDNPGFDPVAAQIQALGVPLIAHQAEPRNCWLPLDQMTTQDDREYFQEHPQYYMFKHPEMPAYETLMAARDRFVARHPDLVFVGAHMASLEWSIDRVAAFLDAHPNAVVDLAQRLPHVELQSTMDRARVRAFFIRYADRLIYATDATQQPTDDPAAFQRDLHATWLADWTYLATDETQHVVVIDRDVAGLSLPRSVIDKLYWGNAHRVFSKLSGQGG